MKPIYIYTIGRQNILSKIVMCDWYSVDASFLPFFSVVRAWHSMTRHHIKSHSFLVVVFFFAFSSIEVSEKNTTQNMG